MSNIHRIMWFDKHIKAKKFPNRKNLAEKFEISIRQAQRDIDYLKDSLGAPLSYDAKERGYYYEDETFTLPNIYINDEQMKLLSFLAYSYENYTQTPKVTQVTELFKKLTEKEVKDDSIPVFDLEKHIAKNFYYISNAIKTKNKLYITYRDSYKGNIESIIHPYKLFHRYRADYIACYSEDAEKITVLRVDRIMDLKMLNQGFEVSTKFEDREYSSFIEKDPYVARIKFTKVPDSLDLTGLNFKLVDEFIYDVEFYDVHCLIKYLINIDYWEKIYSPKWLKRKLAQRCSQVLDKLDL
ncbi:helix-turn-helix transcriptional regulator [Abyssisolibacter fermentans]|uniref:helix-turn-helix transcriptional regulator n=1 Tax=Abyssisolibacter fermentans TaxID=1766203 RepID=UPI00082E459A|nr:WYL domain-containing protein [Abyssisolibacter fermentans]